MTVFLPIKEGDIAGEHIGGDKPSFGRDPQPAGDGVAVSCPQGSSVRCHTNIVVSIFNLPGHTDMIWVEVFGHTYQGLLLFIVFLVSTLVFWRWKYFYYWWGGFTVLFCKYTKINLIKSTANLFTVAKVKS